MAMSSWTITIRLPYVNPTFDIHFKIWYTLFRSDKPEVKTKHSDLTFCNHYITLTLYVSVPTSGPYQAIKRSGNFLFKETYNEKWNLSNRMYR